MRCSIFGTKIESQNIFANESAEITPECFWGKSVKNPSSLLLGPAREESAWMSGTHDWCYIHVMTYPSKIISCPLSIIGGQCVCQTIAPAACHGIVPIRIRSIQARPLLSCQRCSMFDESENHGCGLQFSNLVKNVSRLRPGMSGTGSEDGSAVNSPPKNSSFSNPSDSTQFVKVSGPPTVPIREKDGKWSALSAAW